VFMVLRAWSFLLHALGQESPAAVKHHVCVRGTVPHSGLNV